MVQSSLDYPVSHIKFFEPSCKEMICVDHNVTKKIYIVSWCAILCATKEVILISRSLVIRAIEPNHVISSSKFHAE